jgi:hypothetical protein
MARTTLTISNLFGLSAPTTRDQANRDLALADAIELAENGDNRPLYTDTVPTSDIFPTRK